MEIKGKHALVTGAGAGIGRASAIMLAQQGAKSLTLIDIDEEQLLSVARELVQIGSKVTSYAADLRDADCVQNLVCEITQRHDAIDIVFNNAGAMTGQALFIDQRADQLINTINLNLTAIIISSKLFIDHMRDTERPGVIINTSSTAALNPMPADPAFAAAKVGILRFCQSCRDLHETSNIRVVALCPGWTNTSSLPRGSEWLKPALRNIQLLEPEDIAKAVKNIIEDDGLAGDHVTVENPPRV